MRKTHTPFVILTILLVTPVTSFAAEPKPDGPWQPLWDGKSLTGWHRIGHGEWKVQEGLLVGDHPNTKEDYGHLVTDKTYKDFTARIIFKAVKGNSGFYFRIRKEGFSGVTGFQAEIDAANDVGGLYETNGKGWVVQPKPEDVKKFFKPQDWNEMIVTAKGDRLQVWVNGTKTADTNYPQAKSKEGHLALQVHGGQAVQVLFKSIEILP